MVVIRLQRTGRRNSPSYRVVVTDSRASVRGGSIEVVGSYDPIRKTFQIQNDKVEAWKLKGAQISEAVARLIGRDGKAPEKKALKPNRKSVLRAKMAEEAKAAEAAAKIAEKEAEKAAKLAEAEALKVEEVASEPASTEVAESETEASTI